MKLKNKKTGEIIIPSDYTFATYDDGIRYGRHTYYSLAELNEEWEDYEEPKPWWYIDITLVVKQGELFLNNHVEQFKTVGNYFETKEEAEKAVEKLKAWKRLKGEIVGWSFSYDLDLNGCGFNDEDIVVGIKLPRNASKKDLDLLFGGEK